MTKLGYDNGSSFLEKVLAGYVAIVTRLSALAPGELKR